MKVHHKNRLVLLNFTLRSAAWKVKFLTISPPIHKLYESTLRIDWDKQYLFLQLQNSLKVKLQSTFKIEFKKLSTIYLRGVTLLQDIGPRRCNLRHSHFRPRARLARIWRLLRGIAAKMSGTWLSRMQRPSSRWKKKKKREWQSREHSAWDGDRC